LAQNLSPLEHSIRDGRVMKTIQFI